MFSRSNYDWELHFSQAEVITKEYECCPGTEYAHVAFTIIYRKSDNPEDNENIDSASSTLVSSLVVIVLAATNLLNRLL